MKRAISAAIVAVLLSGCTHSGEVYDKKKHAKEEYSSGNTAAAALGVIAGAALIVAAANSGGGGGGYAPSYIQDYDHAWDYQPMNRQWVCRGKQTGQYHEYYKCQYKPVHDYTWPG